MKPYFAKILIAKLKLSAFFKNSKSFCTAYKNFLKHSSTRSQSRNREGLTCYGKKILMETALVDEVVPRKISIPFFKIVVFHEDKVFLSERDDL